MTLTTFYRELLKRLDDSSDEIRLDACLTLTTYLRVVPADYDRTHFKYLLRGLLVHLDDTNPAIQVLSCCTQQHASQISSHSHIHPWTDFDVCRRLCSKYCAPGDTLTHLSSSPKCTPFVTSTAARSTVTGSWHWLRICESSHQKLKSLFVSHSNFATQNGIRSLSNIRMILLVFVCHILTQFQEIKDL